MCKREPLVLYRNLCKKPTRQSLSRNKNAAVPEAGNGGVCMLIMGETYFAALGCLLAVNVLITNSVAIIKTMASGRTMNTFCTKPAMM